MKKAIKFLALLFTLTAICGILVACNNDNTDETPPTTTTAATTTTANDEKKPEPDPEPTEVTVNAEFLKDYKIVTAFDADEDSVAALIAGIKEKTGVELTSSVDTAGGEVSAKEILVGNTNREGSFARDKGLSYGIALKGEKIVITYGSDVMLEEAVDYFVNLFVDGSVTLPLDYKFEKDHEIKIDGVGIGEYKIVYAAADEDGKTAAEFLAAEILKATGVEIAVIDDSESRGIREIVIGETNRLMAPVCTEYYSYEISATDVGIFLGGYDNYALNNAAYGLISALIDAKGDAKLADLNITYKLPEYTEYLEDIDKLYMRWIAEWQPDPRMLDYNLKIAAYKKSSDRLLTCAHRADGYYYPENSLEAIISYYKMGGDVVELDIQATKDGVLVLMHDATLSRMTDWSAKKGKNGLPTSNNVKDWTYEQIQQLNLREAKGYKADGSKSDVTPFKVPTLVEALKLCKGRLLIIPDKTDKWRYTDNDNLVDSPKYYLLDAMKAADNYESILLSYGLTPMAAADVQKKIYAESGVIPFIMVRDNNASKTTYNYLFSKTVKEHFGIQVGGTFNSSSTKARLETFQEWRKTIVLWGWTIGETGDEIKTWQEMYDLGYRMIMNNAYLDLVKYATTTFTFD